MARLIIVALTLLVSACGADQNLTNPHTGWVIYCTATSVVPGAGDVREPPASVFIFAGQSNMVGAGRTSEQPATGPISNVVVWATDHWETYKPWDCFGPDLQFALNWQRDRPNETVGIIKYAVGGTSMASWQVNGPLYTNLIAQYQAAGSLPVHSIIWMQGEGDAAGQADSQYYPSRIEAFVSSLQSITSAPFVFGQTAMTIGAYWSAINAEQVYLDSWDHVTMAPTLDLTTWEQVHLDTASQLELGDRLYLGWSAIE